MPTQKRKTKGTPDPVDIHVGQRLKVRRSLLGLSQDKLAKAIGLTFQQIQKYEQGSNRISAGRLYQFSKILKVPIPYFYENFISNNNANEIMGLSDNEQDTFISDDVFNNKETLELIRAYYAIKDVDLRKDTIKFIKSVAERTQK